jgi:hypothetical protein
MNLHGRLKRFQNFCISSSEANSPRRTCAILGRGALILGHFITASSSRLDLHGNSRQLFLVFRGPERGLLKQLFQSNTHQLIIASSSAASQIISAMSVPWAD